MKPLFLLVACLFSALVVAGQSDSSQVKITDSDRDSLYRELFNFGANSTFGEAIITEPAQARFGFQDNYPAPFYWGFVLNPFVNKIEITGNTSIFNPFFSSFTVTSFASYNLGNKVSLKGASFSGKSLLDLNSFDTNLNNNYLRGASMFLQYKISKGFQIGGGISIQNH